MIFFFSYIFKISFKQFLDIDIFLAKYKVITSIILYCRTWTLS